MAKLKYVQVRGSTTTSKKAHKTTSIVNAQYRTLHEAAYKKIQKKHSEYASAEMRAASIKITSDSSLGQMNHEIQYTIEKLKQIGVMVNIPEEIGGINIYEQIIPACLIMSEQSDPKAQRIVQKDDGDWVSIKAKNITKTNFNVSRMLQIALQLLIMGKGIAENDVLSIVESIYRLISNFYEMAEINLDDCSVKIMLILHEFTCPGFPMDENQLMHKTQERYSEIDETQFHESINKLLHYSCIQIEDGNLSIVETM